MFHKMWKMKSTPSSLIYGWRAFQDRLPTKDRLSRVGIRLQNSLCCLCNSNEESVEHLLVACNVSSLIWNICDKWFGIQTVHHCTPIEHFLGFCHTGVVGKGFRMRGIVWLTIISLVWKHRNEIIFRNRVCDAVEVFAFTQVKTWAIIKAKFDKVVFSFSEWCIDPLSCIKMSS